MYEQILEAERKVARKRGIRSIFWTIQMGTFRNYHQAMRFTRKHKKIHSSLKEMATHLWNIVRRKRAYTAQVGKFTSKAEADKLCATLKKKSLSCLVVKTR